MRGVREGGKGAVSLRVEGEIMNERGREKQRDTQSVRERGRAERESVSMCVCVCE